MKILKVIVWVIAETAILLGCAWIGGKMGEILGNILEEE